MNLITFCVGFSLSVFELDTFLEIFLIYHSYNMLFLTAYNKLALLTLNLSYGVICDHFSFIY